MGKVREGAEAIMKAHQEQKKALEEARAKTDKRSLSAKPTPTAEECDMIKMGVLDLDSKEDDGSGPEMVRVTEMREVDRSMQAAGGAPYETRTATTPDAPRRR